MKNFHFDTIVIGGGIIGLSCAYALSKKGQKVAVIERKHIGAGASGSSAAMLECQTEAHRGDVFMSLAKPSLNLFPSLAEEIKDLTGQGFGYEKNGILNLALNEEEAVLFENETIRQVYSKFKARWLSKNDVASLYPEVTPHQYGGAFFEEDGQLVGERYVAAMAQAARQKGVDIREGEAVTSFKTSKNSIFSVQTSSEIFSAKHFVLAAGAWTDEIASWIGKKIGIVPIRGQLLVYDTPSRPLSHPVYTRSKGYIAPKPDGYTLAGTTVENVGFDDSPTEEARETLRNFSRFILPGLGGKKTRGMIAGLRPGTKDTLPVLGPHPNFPNLILATGHYRSGILLSPITAQIVSALILSEPAPVDIAPFFPC